MKRTYVYLSNAPSVLKDSDRKEVRWMSDQLLRADSRDLAGAVHDIWKITGGGG